VALIARTAEHVGAAAVRKEEGRLVQAAQTHDPGQFLGVTKNFEHRVDAEGALTETNRAHARRYLHLGEPQDGMVRIDRLVEGGGTVPTATVQRYACDTALIRITGRGELEHELSHATRTIPPSTRRALEARDQHCVFDGCDRRLSWCDGHHLVWWIKGGPTTLSNLALLCRLHHRMVHEEGWTLERREGRFNAIPPPRRVRPSSRS